MKRAASLILGIFFLLILGSNSFAAAPEWKIDSDHSGIYFGVSHIYSTVKGHFNAFEGVVAFDPANLKESRFDFKVKVKSIDTNNSKRDGHLQSADFFDAGKYPEMTFKSTAIAHAGGDQYTVEGTMTVKDVSQKITLPFTFFGAKQHPFDPKLEVAGFEARMDIDRLAYHVGYGKFYQMGVVGKDVKVLISIEATRNK
ncbi:MAG: YceI family protein [Desulfobacterales bacterium]|jgi:polyisoprenoid-binding protein YceI|nr:YceI family protein [Desulfobacterales bacterium]